MFLIQLLIQLSLLIQPWNINVFWFVSSVLSHDRTPKNAQNTTHKKEESLSGKKVFSSSAMKKALSCLEYIGDEILSSDMGIIS